MGRQKTLAALPCRLCYRPAVFFHDLRFTAISLPQNEIGAFKKCVCAVFFLWMIPRRLKFMCRRFQTLCSTFISGVVKMEQTECSEMSAHKIKVPGNHPKERKQHSDQGEILKSRNITIFSIHF